MLITDTHTDQTVKMRFLDSGFLKMCINPSKSPFGKFDPKTILSQLLHGQEKVKIHFSKVS